MHFKVLTLFPETIAPYVNSSILGRAQAAGKISVEFFNIRDYSLDKRRRVDDTPYGGGYGMLMTPQPHFGLPSCSRNRSFRKNADHLLFAGRAKA